MGYSRRLDSVHLRLDSVHLRLQTRGGKFIRTVLKLKMLVTMYMFNV